MDLIERYVQEVGHRLPRGQREDVTRELRSSLEDSLEDRAGAPLDQVGEDAAVAMLLDFGPPQEVAASYRTGPQFLIGPALYPIFIKTMKVALAVVAGLIALGLVFDMAGNAGGAQELIRVGARAISNIQSGFLIVLGLVVLVFAVIERSSTPFKDQSEEWNPQDLPPIVKDADEVDRTGTVVGLVISLMALLLVNFAPQWFRIHVFSDGERFSAPLFEGPLSTELIIFNGYLVLGLVLGVVALIAGRWQLRTRIADAAVSAILVVFLSRLWSRSGLLLPDETDLLSAGWPAEQAERFAETADSVLSPLLWWVLLVGILAAVWVTIRKVVAIVRTTQSRQSGSVSVAGEYDATQD